MHKAVVNVARAFALGFWILQFMYVVQMKVVLAMDLTSGWGTGTMTAGQCVGVVAIVLFFTYFQGYLAFHRGVSPMMVQRTLGMVESTPCYVLALGVFYVFGLFDGTRKRLCISWAILPFVILLNVVTAATPWPYQQAIDLGVGAGLGIGAISMLYFTCLAWVGRMPKVDPQFAPRVAETCQDEELLA